MLPVLLLILTAILKFGLMFNNYITLTDAVRSGARTLALGRGMQANPCTPADLAGSRQRTPTLNLRTAISATRAFSGAETCMTGQGWFQGDQATMTGTYGCDLTILGIDLYPGCTLTVSATEAIE